MRGQRGVGCRGAGRQGRPAVSVMTLSVMGVGWSRPKPPRPQPHLPLPVTPESPALTPSSPSHRPALTPSSPSHRPALTPSSPSHRPAPSTSDLTPTTHRVSGSHLESTPPPNAFSFPTKHFFFPQIRSPGQGLRDSLENKI